MADISNSTSDTLVSGTSGNDSIYNYYWNSQATINSGAGDDEIYNSGTQVSIDAGAGDDFISNGNYGDNVSISGGSGNDSIYNSGTQVTINSGDGHDSIYNWNSQITINSGDGDDSIYNDGSQVTINAGDGDDYIRNFGTQVTINAGDGDDSIFAAGSEQLIQYTNGDGNDTIYGYDETDTIKITDGSSYTTQVSGNDVIVNVGGGSMRLIDVKDKTLNIVNHQAVNDTPTGGNGGTNTQPSVGKSDTPTGSQRTASPTSTTTDALTYNEITNKIKTHNTVTLGSGWSGTIKSSDYDSTVKNVNASNTSSALYIVGNSNANNIIGGSGDNTINSGKGNDTLTGSSGNNIFVYDSGDGNDIITDYSPGEDLIKLNSGTIKKVSVNKNNVVLTVDKQTITLKDAKGKKITVNDSEGNISSQVYGDTNIKISDGDGQTVNASLNPTAVTLDGTSRTTDLNLIANAKANVIYLGAGHTTVTAGRGNDTITSSDGANVFVYNLNDGADVITDYAVGQDVIHLGSGVKLTKAATVKGTNDVLLSVTKGSIRFKDGVGKKITIMDADGNTTNQTYGVQSINIADDDDSTINTTIDAMIETINASTRTKDVNIIGNAKNNTIIGGSGNDELFGGKGKDVFVYNGGNDIISDYTAGQDIVQLDSVSITSAAYTGQNGTDLVLNTDKGTLTIENVIKLKSNKGTITKVLPPQKVTIIDKDGINVGAQVYGADYASTINVVNADGAIIKANLDVDVINAAKRSTTVELIGNDKDNTLIGGTKNDTFVYTGGNDVITNYNPKQKDVIELKDTTLSTYHIDGKDVVLELANGKTLTVNNGKGQTITFVDSDGNSTSDTALYNDYNEKVLTNTDAAKFEATIDSRIITIDASKRDTKHAIEIIGNAQDNTIYGGKGNDTLAGGSGADFFVYVNGSGKDVITDYEVGADVIQLGAKTTISKAVAVDDDFVFTIGKGSITVKDGANKIINVIDADGTKLAYNYNYVASRNFVEDVEPEVLADDNFASDNVDNLIPQTSNTAVSLTNLNIDYTSINVDNKYQSTLVSYNN